MKKGWDTRRLSEIAEYSIGLTYSPKDVSTEGIIVLRSSNIQDDELDLSDLVRVKRNVSDKLKLRQGDILMCSRNGSKRLVGKTTMIGNHAEEMTFGTFMTVVRSKHSSYLNWFFKSDEFRSQIGGGENPMINQITKYMLDDIMVPFPPFSEQQRIVRIIDEAFEGIATAKANAEKNLQNAWALFDSELEGVFGQRSKDWTRQKLKDVCAITSTLVDPRELDFLKLTHVGAGNIASKTGALFGLKTAEEEKLISGKFLFDESMVLYSKIRPYLMKVARPTFKGLCSADMYPLTPQLNQITRDFLFHLLLTKQFTDYAVQGSARAGMPKVNREHLFEFEFWSPPIAKQKVVASKLDALATETQRLSSTYERKLKAIETLKTSVLHSAFSGQL
jgi:type I restriction enzyme, S subunit